MKKTHCIIIDDEPIAIRILERHLDVFSDLEVVETFISAHKALTFLRTHQVDIIFCDIQMPLMTGIEFLQSLRRQPAIIFTTAYRHYAVEAYDLDVLDYLLKPISVERLGRAINRYYERVEAKRVDDASRDKDIINIKTNKEIIRLPVCDIVYIESFGDYVIVYHKNGKLTSRERLSFMEEQLAPNGFIRIHRQYLVASNSITAIKGNLLQVGDQQLPVGRTYRLGVYHLLTGV